MKKAAYYEEAKRLFVQEGLSLDAIEILLKKGVSRRTLFTWKEENNWEAQRGRFMQSQAAMIDELTELVRTSIKEARTDPSPHKVYAMTKALYALKMLQGIKLDDSVKDTDKKKISPDTIAEIEQQILGIGDGNSKGGK